MHTVYHPFHKSNFENRGGVVLSSQGQLVRCPTVAAASDASADGADTESVMAAAAAAAPCAARRAHSDAGERVRASCTSSSPPDAHRTAIGRLLAAAPLAPRRANAARGTAAPRLTVELAITTGDIP